MEIVYRAAVIYLFLFFVMRVLGKKELGQMSAFELVLLLAIGTFSVLILLGSFVSYRFPRTRTVLEGIPVVVVQDGRLRTDVMRLERLTDSELHEAMREQGIDDLAKVRIGLLEADGKFAFVTREEHEPAPDKPSS